MSTSPSVATPPPSTEWTNPQLLSNDDEPFGLTIAPDGYAVATTWQPKPNGCDAEHCPPGEFIKVWGREPEGRWLNGQNVGSNGLQVAFDAASNGWAAWIDQGWSTPATLMVASRPAGGQWATRETVASGPSVSDFRLLVTDTSTPVLWRSAPATDGYQLDTMSRTSTGWEATTKATAGPASLRAGVAGTLRAVWVQGSTGQGSALVATERRADGTWTRDMVVLRSSSGLSDPAWIGPHAVALTTSAGGRVIATEGPDGSWETHPAFPAKPHWSAAYEAAGVVTVAWLTPEGEVRARHGRVDGRWSSPKTLGRLARSARLVVDSRGNASLFWVKDDDDYSTRYAQRPVGTGWTATGRPPPPVDRGGVMYGYVVAAVDGADTVTVAAASSENPGWPYLHTADLVTPVALTRIRATPPGNWATSTSFRAGWRTTWLRAGNHDVRARVRSIDGRTTGPRRLASGVRAGTKILHAKAGRTYCLSARAHAGPTTGPWGEETCVSTPLDDRVLSRSAGWTRAGTTSTTRSRGATLTSPRIRGSRFALLVRPSADAGTVRVTFDGRRLGTHRLVAGRPGRPRVIALGGFRRPRHGKLAITVVSSGRPVRIDGIYAR